MPCWPSASTAFIKQIPVGKVPSRNSTSLRPSARSCFRDCHARPQHFEGSDSRHAAEHFHRHGILCRVGVGFYSKLQRQFGNASPKAVRSIAAGVRIRSPSGSSATKTCPHVFLLFVVHGTKFASGRDSRARQSSYFIRIKSNALHKFRLSEANRSTRSCHYNGT